MKRGRSKTIKIMLKYHAVYCLGFGMLQLSNCCLEDLKNLEQLQHWLGGHSTGQWPVERKSTCIYSSPCQCEIHLISLPTYPNFCWYATGTTYTYIFHLGLIQNSVAPGQLNASLGLSSSPLLIKKSMWPH